MVSSTCSISFFVFFNLLLFINAYPLQYHSQELHTVVRDTGFTDLRAEWTLEENTDESKSCPTKITHTTWSQLSGGRTGMPHNTILEDDQRCDSVSDEKAFVFVSSEQIDEKLNTVDKVADIPAQIKKIITTTGENIKYKIGLDLFKESYLIGYETQSRFCGGKTHFKGGSVGYLFRPFKAPGLTFDDVDIKLAPGKRWLVMVPVFEDRVCIYSAEIEEEDTTQSSPEATNAEDSAATDSDTTDSDATDPAATDPAATDSDSTDSAATDSDATDSDATDSASSPEPTSEDDDPVCFPRDAIVTLQDGSSVPMNQLSIGDKVLVGKGQFSPVFGFSHKDDTIKTSFVRMETAQGATLTATPGHIVYANNKAVPAREITIGDHFVLADGTITSVVKISKETRYGLFNPQTIQGDIVVDGVLASTYTTTVEQQTAHAILAPLRAFSRVCGLDVVAAAVEGGARATLIGLRSAKNI